MYISNLQKMLDAEYIVTYIVILYLTNIYENLFNFLIYFH